MTSRFQRKIRVGRRPILLAALGALLPMPAGVAMAADAPAPAVDDTGGQPTGLGEIVVTARKRKESSLDVPVAITALSAKALDALNVKTIEQVVAVTPGLVLNNATTGSARSDRSKTALIIRAMAPSIGNQTTSVFVNGVPISDGIVSGIFDFDHVEVLKGPQSAYFGRQTFAGAINLITKDPTNTLEGYGSALFGSGNYYDVNGAIGGPLIKDILSVRVSGRYYTRDGSWANNAEPGQTLGDQSTRSGTLALKFTPSNDLTVKLFGMLAKDNDGPGATGIIEPSQSNCTINGNPYFCGKVPQLESGQPSLRTTITPAIQTLTHDYSTEFSGEENINHFGLKRATAEGSASIEYRLDHGITINSLTGYNRDNWSVLYMLNGRASPFPAPITGGVFQDYTDWPFGIQHKQRDFSQEFRLSSGQNQRFRWMIGGSYLWQEGKEGYNQLYYFSGLSQDFSPTTESKTWGGFYGLAFDFTKWATLDFDGRYQSDKLISRDGATDAIAYTATYGNFTPRVSFELKPTRGTMFYATYSKGVNPGLGSDPLLAVPTAYVATLEAMGVTHGVKPEKLDNYELGFKGRLFDDRLVISGDIYYDIWNQKITEQTILIPRAGLSPVFVSVFTNEGKVTLKGIEAEATAMPVPGLTFDVSGAINDSRIDSGSCAFCLTETGSSTASAIGNELPFTSKYSAQASAEYDYSFSGSSAKWYGRAEMTYKSGMWESEANYAKTMPATNVNFRVGVRGPHYSLEGFVTNAFNNKAYTSVLPDFQLDNPAETYAGYDTLYVGLPYLRTFGVRLGYNF